MVIEDTAAAGSESGLTFASRVSILFDSAVWIPATVCAIFLFWWRELRGNARGITPPAFCCFVFSYFAISSEKKLDPYRCIDASASISFRSRCIFIKDTSFDGDGSCECNMALFEELTLSMSNPDRSWTITFTPSLS